MSRRYSGHALRDIGQQCAVKLPPASTVRAMFMYEMQRETEVEKLFEGQLFEIAKVQDENAGQEVRLSEVEEHLNSLRQEVKSKDIDERLSTSKVRTDAPQAKAEQHEIRLESLDKWVAATTSAVKSVDEILHTHDDKFKGISAMLSEQTATLAALTSALDTKVGAANAPVVQACHKIRSVKATSVATTATLTADVADHTSMLQKQDEEIGILYEERDALVTRLETADSRIAKLEDLVRQLSQQLCLSSSNGSSPQVQHLQVQTNDGHPLELVVQKGKPLVPNIRSFEPGRQQWSPGY